MKTLTFPRFAALVGSCIFVAAPIIGHAEDGPPRTVRYSVQIVNKMAIGVCGLFGASVNGALERIGNEDCGFVPDERFPAIRTGSSPYVAFVRPSGIILSSSFRLFAPPEGVGLSLAGRPVQFGFVDDERTVQCRIIANVDGGQALFDSPMTFPMDSENRTYIFAIDIGEPGQACETGKWLNGRPSKSQHVFKTPE